MGASILPVTIYDNKVHFLFGKERETDENPGWSDFGGGTEDGESFLKTAAREGSEELTGFLGGEQEIIELLNKYGTFPVEFKSKGHSTYRAHVFPMNYDPKLTHYYNNNQRFLQKRLDPKIIEETKIFEKTKIEWFTFDDMKRRKKEFRSFYQNIVDLLLKDQSSIETFVRRNLLGSNKKRRTTQQRQRRQQKPTHVVITHRRRR